MQLFAAYAKVKRKTFWVIRYVEITQEGNLYYRDKKEDKQNKCEYKLSLCKIKELVTNGGNALLIQHQDESLKVMAHTNQEHKKIVQAIQQIKQNSQQKSDIIQIDPQPRQTQIPSIIIQQTKPPQFCPDNELVKQSQGDQIKILVSQLIKKFESQPVVLLNVIDGVQIYRLDKEQQQNVKEENIKKRGIFDAIQDEIQSVGYLMTAVIGCIFFLLFSILIYLLLSIVDNRNYTYSIIITLNIITLPLIFKKPQAKKEVPIEKYTIQGKCQMSIDYNGLIYLLSKFETRKEWTPNLLLINNDNNLITTLYLNQSVEKFNQSVYYDQDCFYFVEHHQLQILRLFIVKYLFDEDNVEITCITDNSQISLLPCLKQFIKLQRQNPKSLLIEYLTSKTSTDQISIIQSEIIYKPIEQTTQSSSPIQQQLEPPQQISPSKINIPPQIVQQNIPPEVQRIFNLTLEAKQLLEKLYPICPAWQQQSDKGGFKIHTRLDEASGQTMSRGEGILPYQMGEIFEIIEKVEKRGDYDSLFDSGYMLKRLDPDTGIVYQRFKTIKIVVKSRDFVFVSRVFREDNRWVVVAKSLEVPELPPIKDSVRGELLIAGWILERTEQGTRTTFITMVDPKGSIPAAIVASSAKEQGQCVEKVKVLLDKRNRK